MAIGWLTLLKTVPWGDVISTAPVVADGAKKLWSAVSNKPAPDQPPLAPSGAAGAEDANEKLRTQLASLEAGVAELQQQMRASTGLIKALAEQNTELVKRVEAHRLQLRWLSAVLALFVASAAMAIAVVLAR